MERAYSVFEVKAVDDEQGIIEGIASTPTTDRMGDIVEPKGAQFKLPIPLLWQHNSREPLGHVLSAKVTEAGIAIKAKIERGVLPEIDRAWALIKSGLVRGLSIGFRSIEDAEIKGTWGTRFMKWEWLELSAVTIPANSEATIQTIKSICDQDGGAASGAQSVAAARGGDRRHPKLPGVAGDHPSKGTKMNVREQIAAFEAKRAATEAAAAEIMQKAADAGETLDGEQAAEYDNLKAQVKSIDDHLARLRDLEKMQAASAKAVVQDTSEPETMKVKAGDGVLRVNANVPKGMALARYVKALAYARGNKQDAIEYAKQWRDSTPEVEISLKTAVAGGTTADSTWAGPLVYNQDMASEFINYLRPQTILGKLDGLRRVPFNIRYASQTSGTTVGWVGQGKGKPVSKPQYTSGSLGFAKQAGIVVITEELARFSSPAAEETVRNDLVEQMIYFGDQQFIDPGVAAVANVNPASILNGASAVRQAAATWTSAANIETDVKAFYLLFANQEIDLQGAYWIMTPGVALAISMIRTAQGENFAYPGISVMGGTFFGLPVIVSNAVPHSTSAGSIIALVKPSEVFLADDGQIAVDVSREASIEMVDAPTQDATAGTGASLVSMWQSNSVAIRVERMINYSRRRSYGVGYIDNLHVAANP